MTSIDEWQRKYPSIQREVILKWAVLSRGIKDTDDLDKVSKWQEAGEHWSYQTYDHDITLKELVEKRPSRKKDGRVLRPKTIFMKNGIGANIQLDTRSPYEIREIREGRFALFDGEDQVDMDLYFPAPTPRTTPEPVTSKGTPLPSLINRVRSCFRIMPVRYCEYFAMGEQCKFCNFNGTQDDSRVIGLGRPVTINLDDVVEGYRILSSEIKLLEGRFEMGGIVNSEHEAGVHIDFVGKIASAASYKPNLTVHTQAMDRKHMQRLKDAGLDSLSIQLEAWEPQTFAAVCPGKVKHASYEAWLEAMIEAVDVFGAGNVGGKIISGLSMMPENGHKTWQESLASHIQGNTWMIKNGVIPNFTNLRLPPGSVYGADKSLRDRLPPTEYYLDLMKAHNEDMLEYGLYEKTNRLFKCGLDCASGPYSGEIGMLSIAGDVGKWMAAVVPYEFNWLAQFIDSIKSTAKTE